MDRTTKCLILLSKFLLIFKSVHSYTYSVKVSTDSHVNVVDSRFLSFTVDPKYLFSRNEKFHSKDSSCMATSLTPAYIRIAGPSTSHLTFHNSTITFTDLGDLDLSKEEELEARGGFRKRLFIGSSEEDDHTHPKKKETFSLKKRLFPNIDSESGEYSFRKPTGLKNKRQSKGFGLKKGQKKVQEVQELAITHTQWQQFVHWTKNAGFDLVFALNNNEKTQSGLWDPNSSLKIMTLAEQANVSEIFWQLGYECSNQSIDEYLNDLETLRAIVDTFTAAREWRSVGGDITKCLQADSKSDFRDYITLTDDMMDAVVLNGNSSAHELQRMSEKDRLKLLQLLSTSSTPLWLTDTPQLYPHSETHRAADWMTSLGYSARNGFAIHFRQLVEEELFEPTLSFYMALLFKNLVGDRVLNVDMEGSQAVVFAHCTSLRRKPVPGAVTLYGANLDDETARFAVKLSRREEGGDIMQFILGHDLNGNIIINGRSMYEGELRPTVKRVRAYKTLLLNLPPRSFGFWVVANTKIAACQENEDQDITDRDFVAALPVNEDDFDSSNTVKAKRSMVKDESISVEVSKETLVRQGLKERIETLNTNINNVKKMFFEDIKKSSELLSRKKRQLDVEDELDNAKRKIRKYFKKKYFDEPKPRLNFIRKLIGINPRSARTVRHNRIRKTAKGTKNKGTKRNTKDSRNNDIENISIDEIVTSDSNKKLSRRRRHVIEEEHNVSHKNNDNTDTTSENEIFDADSSKEMKLWKILHKIHKQIKDLSMEDEETTTYSDNSENTDSKGEEQFIVKTKMEEDGATIKLKEKTRNGLLKTTVHNVISVLGDLNKNLNRFWNALTLLE